MILEQHNVHAQGQQPFWQPLYVGEATFHQDQMKDFLQVGKDLGIQELKEYQAINAQTMDQWNAEGFVT